ncbi:MAG: hypothetical protein KKD17_01525 [Nanoarchaeota archaeon]|nr:hypothetical protein [Nanoarchaeota archaeon]
MVEPREFRKRIQEIVSQDYKVEFLGKNFDQIVSILTDTKAGKIYSWVNEVVSKKIQPIFIGSEKQYKNWAVSELFTFRHQFSIGNTEYRTLLVKVKNSIYIEFHLGNHKYYDKIRKELDLKKSSY